MRVKCEAAVPTGTRHNITCRKTEGNKFSATRHGSAAKYFTVIRYLNVHRIVFLYSRRNVK